MKLTRWLLCSVALIPCLAVAGRAETVAGLPRPSGYVNDFAGVLDAASKASIEAKCHEVDKADHAQIAVVTIRTLDGEAVEKFANELEVKWKVGSKGTDRGILMLFAVKEHKRWIEVGYGLEGILNDAKVGDIGRAMVPELKASHYGAALTLGVNDVAQVIEANTPAAAAIPAVVPAQTSNLSTGAGSFVFFLLAGMVLVPVFALVYFVRRVSRRGSRMGTGYGPGIMPYDSGYSDGSSGLSDSSGSGSSDSGSSSSSSDFGGFDGGDSGGGGAGGDW